MLHKLKIRLILLNTVITGLILSAVMIGVCRLNLSQFKENRYEGFLNIRDSILYNLENEQIIRDSWLANLEANSNLIIHIEDNGTPFLYNGYSYPFSSRDSVINEVKSAVLKEGINTGIKPSSSGKINSSVLDFSFNHMPVYASVSLISVRDSYISLTLIQVRPEEFLMILKQILLFFFIDLLGIFALFLVSCFFVDRALRPVEENQKKQVEFIASASHDLRSPLAVIQTNASALLIDGTDRKHFVQIITQECTRMSGLIHDMLILASSDAKTWSIQKMRIDTDTYLIELYESLSSYCTANDHTLSLDFTEKPLPEIYADKDRLTQTLGILIDNAVSYSPPKSRIVIRPYIKKAVFFIEVEDHGIGITNEQKKYIFDRFYRTDKSRNDNSHFGLGLSVAKELMELQGGKITLRDTPSGGSTFTVEVPL